VDVFWLGAVAVSLSYSAYVAEVLRAGILSVHPSQRAAARSLGLSQAQTMRHVVLPQAIRSVAPALLNDFVSLLKDTGLISVLGVVDAIRAAQIEASQSFNFTPYVVASLIFLVVTVPLTRLTDRVLLRQLARQNAQGAA
jgi:polar amino acid transport system permease protein